MYVGQWENLCSECRRDQEEGGELDSHEKVRLICGSRRDQEEGGELDSHEKVRLICGSRRDQKEGGGAGPSRESRRDQKLGSESCTFLLLKLFLNSGATDRNHQQNDVGRSTEEEEEEEDIVFVTAPHGN